MRILIVLAALCAVLVPASVQARPRDEAMSGAFRCAVIADTRVWLDCFYGAAQPVRAGLGLPSAPAAQLRLAAAPPASGAAPPDPARDEVMTAATGCISLPAERAWLDCYYAASRAVRAELGLPSLGGAAPYQPLVPAAPIIAARPAAPAGPPPMPRRQAGLFSGIFNDPKPIVHGLTIRSYTIGKDGAFTVTLSDGQVWKQGENDAIYNPVHWRGEGMTVTIAPGAMHTFNMQVSGEEKMYKVSRIR